MIDPKEYGRALFLLAEERAATERVYADLLRVRDALREHTGYLSLMDTPALSRAEKERLLDEAFGSLDGDVVSFLKLLSGRHSLYEFPRTLRVFEELYEQSVGIVRAEAVTAVPMTKEQRDRLCARLSASTGKQIRLSNTVDPEVLGGMQLRYLGRQLDGTLRSRIEGIERAIKNTIV